jgi:predicted dehydrogenase
MVRLGIVGCGGMGTNHATHASELGHEVVAVADVAPAVRESFAAEFDAATYEEFAEMYDDAAPDAVVVTTPNAFHEPAAVAALDRDIAVLCEKPLAADLAGAEAIAAAAGESDAFCTVGFMSRFSGSAQMFVAHRERGRFGDITHIEANYVRRRGIPGVGSWFTDAELAGGGSLIDVGVHILDLALYFADFPEVVEVSGVTRQEFGGSDYHNPDNWGSEWETGTTFDVDDSASAFIRCADGTTISLEVAWASNREPDHSIAVDGTEAGARCEIMDDELTVLETDDAGGDQYADIELETEYEPDGHRREDQVFLDAVAAGEAPSTNTVEQGLTVQRVLDAIYRSSETGGAVEL